MASKALPVIMFEYGKNRSQKDIELEAARVRSHAAKISHARRIAQKLSLSLSSRPQKPPHCECGDPSNCAACNPPVIQHGWQARSLTRHDPFASYAGHDLAPICHDAIDYTLDKDWSNIFSAIRPEEVLSWKLSWKQAAVSSPAFFHTLAVGGTAMVALAVGNSQPSAVKYYHRLHIEQSQLALRWMRKDIEDPTFRPSEVHVQTACWLIPLVPQTTRDPYEPYPLSPLRNLQILQDFAAFDLTMPHVDGMYRMARMIGGISAIKVKPTADILQLFDLFIAVRSDRTPVFELRDPSFESLKSEPWWTSRALRPGHLYNGRRLALVRDISNAMHHLLKTMTELTEVAYLFCDNPESHQYEKAIIVGRNQILHGLLSYPTRQYDPTTFEAENGGGRIIASTEIIRIAASIFNDMVFFPLPWALGIKPPLAKRMRLVWEASQMRQLAEDPENKHTELYIWILWFGCFAAIRSRHQQWFELELLHLFQQLYGPRLQREEFSAVKQILRGFLWWDPVCDVPGTELWSRIVNRATAG